MATENQVQQMLDLMKEQMDTIKSLQSENSRLREDERQPNNVPTAPLTEVEGHHFKTKRPDRPSINAGIDDREWVLVKDSWVRYKKMCNLDAAGVSTTRLELRASCSEELNK